MLDSNDFVLSKIGKLFVAAGGGTDPPAGTTSEPPIVVVDENVRHVRAYNLKCNTFISGLLSGKEEPPVFSDYEKTVLIPGSIFKLREFGLLDVGPPQQAKTGRIRRVLEIKKTAKCLELEKFKDLEGFLCFDESFDNLKRLKFPMNVFYLNGSFPEKWQNHADFESFKSRLAGELARKQIQTDFLFIYLTCVYLDFILPDVHIESQ